jgi:hypothetical protein
MTNHNQQFFLEIKELIKSGDIKGSISLAETKYPEGMYFDLPFDDYCNLPYFSRSGSKDVIFDLEEAKYRMTHSMETTPAMDLGTAIHSMFLEPDDYAKTYVKALKEDDFVDKTVLKVTDDFKEILKSVGEKVSGKKEDLIERARPYIDPSKFIIWDEITAEFYADVEESGKKILSNADIEVMEGLRESYKTKKDIPQIIDNGRAEVTIIWKDAATGIMCKCRLDWIRPEAIVDIKSFSVKDKSKSLFEYLFKQTTSFYYNYQFVVYAEALEEIINKINDGKAKIYGKYDETWMQEFLKNPVKQFFIVYVRTAAPYQMKAIELEKTGAEGGTNNEYYAVAERNWRFAISKFARAVETGIWKEKEIATLQDQYVSNVIYQESIY